MNTFQTIGKTCIALHLRRATRHVARVYDDALRPLNLNNGQFSLMALLAAKSDWTMQELADALGLDQSSLSAAVKPLVRRDLIHVSASMEDKRVRLLRLSTEGRLLINKARPLWRKAQDNAEKILEDYDLDEIRSALRTLS